ncbi:protein of unknown function [Cupriavidus taiwanensis]|nr:protein of unknown function [Cupriavidus taiwanensis]
MTAVPYRMQTSGCLTIRYRRILLCVYPALSSKLNEGLGPLAALNLRSDNHVPVVPSRDNL